jgi:hypothetical protein
LAGLLILAQTGSYATGASSTSKHKSASAFTAYGRKSKPPASQVVVDSRFFYLEIAAVPTDGLNQHDCQIGGDEQCVQHPEYSSHSASQPDGFGEVIHQPVT